MYLNFKEIEFENTINQRNQAKLVLLAPDLMETPESLNFAKSQKQERENTIKERPKSSRGSSARPKSSNTSNDNAKSLKSSVSSSLKATSLVEATNKKPSTPHAQQKLAVAVESNLNRQPSNTLKKIAERQMAKESLIIIEDMKMSDFFTLDVNETVNNNNQNLRTPSATSISSTASTYTPRESINPVKASTDSNFKLSNKCRNFF